MVKQLLAMLVGESKYSWDKAGVKDKLGLALWCGGEYFGHDLG